MNETRYRYQDPSGDYEMTRSQVLAYYWGYWCDQMRRVGKDDQITEEACIEDFCTSHWAWKIEEK